MTLLRRERSEGASYLELAQFLRRAGDPTHVAGDLEQLFRRVLFSVAVGNRDDRLRNHSFILGANGWRLAPAFDANPNIDKGEHVLNLDGSDNRPSLPTVLTTEEFFGLDASTASRNLNRVLEAVDAWSGVARQWGISGADIAVTAGAFSAHAECRK
jgi:serine/threonine-protein kinase HipA